MMQLPTLEKTLVCMLLLDSVKITSMPIVFSVQRRTIVVEYESGVGSNAAEVPVQYHSYTIF